LADGTPVWAHKVVPAYRSAQISTIFTVDQPRPSGCSRKRASDVPIVSVRAEK